MKILGIGNAIVDVISKVDDEFIKKNNLTKSPMKLIFDEKEFKQLLSNLKIEKGEYKNKELQLVIITNPNAKISYNVNEIRQKIVDSWPSDINDNLAKKDWGWNSSRDFTASIINGFLKKYK